MALRQTLFPPVSRQFPGQRWANIGLRTLHLMGMAGLGGGFFYPAVDSSWVAFLYLTLLSGVALSLLFIWTNGIWLIQLRGQAILVKLALLGCIPLWPDHKVALLLAVILLSGLISHAPGDVRYYSLFHRRRIERF